MAFKFIALALGVSAANAMPTPLSFEDAVAKPVCSMTSYCCPDAKHCLTPIEPPKACSATAPCATGETCCPLTKMCVNVGPACTPPKVCPKTSYCCPDAKHCLTPVKAGTFCDPSTKGSCAAGEVCCPVTKECVKPGAACVAP